MDLLGSAWLDGLGRLAGFGGVRGVRGARGGVWVGGCGWVWVGVAEEHSLTHSLRWRPVGSGEWGGGRREEGEWGSKGRGGGKRADREREREGKGRERGQSVSESVREKVVMVVGWLDD